MTKQTEYQFLPAALEIQDSPPSPIGRWIIWSIVILFSLAVLWAIFGKVDIVAVAQGKIIHSGKSKTIQPLQPGYIKAIHVKEGQQVMKGDLLIELDSTISSAEKRRLEDELNSLGLEKRRLELFVKALEQDDLSVISEDVNLPKQHQYLLKQSIYSYQDNLSALKDAKERAASEVQVIETQIERYNEIIPVLQKRFDIYEKMSKKGIVSKVDYLQVQKEQLETLKGLESEQGRKKVAVASLNEATNRIKALKSKHLSDSLLRITEIDTSIEQLNSEVDKTNQQQFYERLVSPIDGTVQQLAVNTIGGVVTSAQPLMIIVPQNRELIAEAKIMNKDIGFIYEEQKASVKVDAFNFTKYGLIDGEVISISEEAIEDEKLGLFYSTRVKLSENKINVDGKWVNLSPGMSVSVEIKTGERRLIEYFLSPILRHKQESIKER